MGDLHVYHSFYADQAPQERAVRMHGIPVFYGPAAFVCREALKKIQPDYRSRQLQSVIRKIRPDIVHSMEIQHAGYLTLEARKRLQGGQPPWIVTNWGSDIFLYGRLAAHRPRISQVLQQCDYYSCECERDIRLAKEYGFTGKALPVFPNSGGFDLEVISRLRSPGPVSARRFIMLKGYQNFAGRALVGLRALERCADLLQGYQVVLYSAHSEDILIATEIFQQSTGIRTIIIPNQSPHEEILKYHGQARISLGLSIGDAISTSLIEAMAMGSFPIQSETACADEWLEDGKNGMIVPPEDPDLIEKAIRRALTDDNLVNKAAEVNDRIVRERLNQDEIRAKTISFYSKVARGW